MFPLLLCLLLSAEKPVTDGGVVTIKGQRLLAEVARTPKERERALAFRSQFKSERCLFVACEQDRPHPVHTPKFLLPFDVAWIDSEGAVVEVLERIPPCKSGVDCPAHGGTKPSRYYVFLAAGMLRRLKIQPGDSVQWDLHFGDGSNLRNGPHVHPDAPLSVRKPRKATRSHGGRK
jgi:uncharacterized membrane protein (UPF0127 family)